MAISIKYKGNITTFDSEKELNTAGKFLEGNIIIKQGYFLPDEYQEVEYLQSSGTQYINTGYVPKTTTEFKVIYEPVSYPATYSTPFGTRQTTESNAFMIGYTSSTGYWEFSPANNSAQTTYDMWSKEKHTIYLDNFRLNIDGTYTSTFSFTENASYNLTVFALNNANTIKEYAAMKLYELKLYENDILIRDYAPCYRISDSVAGLYDMVNGVFYTNSGSGSFTVGPDV